MHERFPVYSHRNKTEPFKMNVYAETGLLFQYLYNVPINY